MALPWRHCENTLLEVLLKNVNDHIANGVGRNTYLSFSGKWIRMNKNEQQ